MGVSRVAMDSNEIAMLSASWHEILSAHILLNEQRILTVPTLHQCWYCGRVFRMGLSKRFPPHFPTF